MVQYRCAGKRVKEVYTGEALEGLLSLPVTSLAVGRAIRHKISRALIQRRGKILPEVDRVGCGQPLDDEITRAHNHGLEAGAEPGTRVVYECPKCGNRGVTDLPEGEGLIKAILEGEDSE